MLGISSAAAWGASDFAGGLLSRRTPLAGVVLVAQSVGAVLALVLALAFGERVPGGQDLAWCLLAACVGIGGMVALYRGLAVGRMGVVAPVTGVLAAAIPVVVGIALQGLPSGLVLVGIALAIVAVVLVSGAPPPETADGTPARRSGVEHALVAGVGLGLFNVLISRVSSDLVFGPLVVVRTVGVALVAAYVVGRRAPWRPTRRVGALLALAGVLDMSGNAAFLAAAHLGRLDVASILSSLYPVMTILLAAFVLRERVGRTHAVGVVAAAAAIALIAGG